MTPIKPVRFYLYKVVDRFIGKDGNPVELPKLTIELLPNMEVSINLTNSNLRVIERHNPDLYQLLSNIPEGHPVIFDQVKTTSQIGAIYSTSENAENEL